MQQFVVPQFIEVENKIIGPITVRQFVLMMAALFVSVATYKFADFGLFIILTGINFTLAGVFSFLKVNGRPLHFFIINFIQTTITPNRRVWNKDFGISEIKKRIEAKKSKKEETELPKPRILEKSRLSEISLVVDTGGRYQGEL